MWRTVWLLTDEIKPKTIWKQPWEDKIKWMEPGVDPAYRLNTLYKDLVVRLVWKT
jgi:hypothetical protein